MIFAIGRAQTYEIPDLAFPTLVGAAINATGGENGVIVEVTNFNSSGAGSLSAACSATGDRIVDFSKLPSAGNFVINSPITFGSGNVTIAGETAPGGGIAIVTQGLSSTLNSALVNITQSNIIWRFVRFRRLGEEVGSSSGNFSLLGTLSPPKNNIVIDHCTFSWSSDDIFGGSFNGMENVTISHNFFYESVEKSNLNTDPAKGVLIYANIANVTMFANAFAHLPTRTPTFQIYNTFSDKNDFVNNVIYNRQFVAMALGAVSGGSNQGAPVTGTQYVNIVGNKFILGASTSNTRYDIAITQDAPLADLSYFVEDNITLQRPNNTLPQWDVMGNDPNAATSGGNASTSFQGLTRFPTDFDYSKAVPVEQVEAFVLANVGANIVRDSDDSRIVNEITNRTGDLIGGAAPISRSYPSLSGSAWDLAPGTHIPSVWANEHGITSDNQIKSNYVIGGKNYINTHNKTAYQIWRFDRAGDLERLSFEFTLLPSITEQQKARQRARNNYYRFKL